jgi:hypothetical protein
MSTKTLARIAAAAAVAILFALLAGCSGFKGFQVSGTGCSGGKCVTAHATINPASGSHHATPTASPVTVTATPTVPESSPTYDPQAAITTCLGPDPTRDDLTALAVYDSTAQQQLIICLRVPQDQAQAFKTQVAQLASQYQDNGQFDDHHGRAQFTGQELPAVAVKCHAGQES